MPLDLGPPMNLHIKISLIGKPIIYLRCFMMTLANGFSQQYILITLIAERISPMTWTLESVHFAT